MEQVRSNNFRNLGQHLQASWVRPKLSPEGKIGLRGRDRRGQTFQVKGTASDVAEVNTHVVYLSWPNKACPLSHNTLK